MIPAVPLIVRLALSALCILVSRTSFALAGWITPELAGFNPDDPGAGRRERRP